VRLTRQAGAENSLRKAHARIKKLKIFHIINLFLHLPP
jgi:hypothetical protein